MTDDILDRLFYGEVSPYDDSPQDIETFRNLNSQLSEIWAQVENRAAPELLELLNCYKVHRADMDMLMQKDRFKVGFRLGIQLLTESTRLKKTDLKAILLHQ